MAHEYIPEDDGLTPYEVWRPPILPTEEDKEITVSLKSLNTHFSCPVCLCILNETHTIMECMHRFCSDCISKSLRLGKKECPSCRMKCPSRRSLRPDTSFDGLIGTFYPNLEEYEAREFERVNAINEYYNTKVVTQSLEEGAKRQAELKRTRSAAASSKRNVKKNKPSPSSSSTAKNTVESTSRHKPQEDTRSPAFQHAPKLPEPPNDSKIEFRFQIHPNETKLPPLDLPYLTAPLTCSIQHLWKYLDAKLSVNLSGEYQISLSKKGRTLVLPKYLTLADILKYYWKSQNDLVLHYSLATTAL